MNSVYVAVALLHKKSHNQTVMHCNVIFTDDLRQQCMRTLLDRYNSSFFLCTIEKSAVDKCQNVNIFQWT